jgi:hypothetical protein
MMSVLEDVVLIEVTVVDEGYIALPSALLIEKRGEIFSQPDLRWMGNAL